MMKRYAGLVAIVSMIVFCGGCASSKKNYTPTKKYAVHELQSDYNLLKDILRQTHPALYWYTAKPNMDAYFDRFYEVIKDSMTEQQFAWLALAPLVNKIYCGHTSVSMSKAYSKWAKAKVTPSFPLYVKFWNDSMVVLANLNAKKDSLFTKGVLITAINEIPTQLVVKYMLSFLPQDGAANNVNLHRLSANFPYYHRNIFGLSKSYKVKYIDSTGQAKNALLPLYMPIVDSTLKDSTLLPSAIIPLPRLTRQAKLLRYRSFNVDSTKKYATLTLHTFSEGRLRKFFRQSFKQLKKQHINNLIIDIRQNGGGKVNMSTLLTKYISKIPFKIADSAYCNIRGLGKYRQYFSGGIFNNIQMYFSSRKGKNGSYHIKSLERHMYSPKQNKFAGQVYVLVSGPTFSAATLFCNAIKGQAGITLVGEETGGGWYGNSGIIIPSIQLPNTKVRVRMPLYKIVQVYHGQPKGSGVIPDIPVPPSYEAIMKGYDKKMAVVKAIITANK